MLARVTSSARASTSAPTRSCVVQARVSSRPLPGYRRFRASGEGSSAAVAVDLPAADQPPIMLTEAALGHLYKMRAEVGGEDLMLRVGVRQGGCSGMSYTMDYMKQGEVQGDDLVVPYDGGNFKLVVDPKSLLYLFGMKLDYSPALIGGGFQFSNPNATDTCGCGKSFGV